MRRKSNKPLIGITLGDPAGIGPEVAIQAALSPKVRKQCQPLLLGDERVVIETLEVMGLKHPVGSVLDIRYLNLTPSEELAALNLPVKNLGRIRTGSLSATAGRAAYEWVVQGADLALNGEIDALVTAPLNKEAVLKAKVLNFRGHTELLAQKSKTRRFAMMLAGGNLRVTLVTTHVGIKNVVRELSQDNIQEKIELSRDFLHQWGIKKPKIAVAALNPHGGEGGAFGKEEIQLIEPVIKKFKKKKMDITGPMPADTLFALHQKEPFDAVVVMYHDQGLIPLKLLSFGKGVNITLGLPFVRTSPDHGTAFNLAGKGEADPGSMIEAVLTAARLVRNRAK